MLGMIPKVQQFLPAGEGFVAYLLNRRGDVRARPVIGWALYADGDAFAISPEGRVDHWGIGYAIIAPPWARERGCPEVLEAIGPTDAAENATTLAEVLEIWRQHFAECEGTEA
jgi:hypothetical protein